MAGIGYSNAPHYRAYPGSFIGRQIGFYEIKHIDTNALNISNGKLDTENFRLAIQTIQLQAEILFIGTPVVSNQWGRFIVGLSVDTANTDAPVFTGDNGMAITLQALLRNVPQLNDNSNQAVVTRLYLWGDRSDGPFYTESEFASAIVANTSTTYVGFAEGSVEQNELIQNNPSLSNITDL
jgi:hypothetical protein